VTRALLVAGSAGSSAGLRAVLGVIGPGCPWAVVCAVHVSPDAGDLVGAAMTTMTRADLQIASDCEPLTPGVVRVAPAGYHLLIDDGLLRLSQDEPVLHSRPSFDVLFRSAAEDLGPDLIAVLLSGANADGAAGLRAIRRRGGRTLVQDPATAEFPQMPRAAVALDAAEQCLAPGAIAEQLLQWGAAP